MHAQRQMAANPQTNPAVSLLLVCCYRPHLSSPFIIIAQPESCWSEIKSFKIGFYFLEFILDSFCYCTVSRVSKLVVMKHLT